MKLSIVMATFQRCGLLYKTLQSIRDQSVPFEYELIVVDDGSVDNTAEACDAFGARYFHLDRPFYTNPAKARNVGYRAARGDVIIAQSDDTIHASAHAIEHLAQIKPGTLNIATVWEMKKNGERGIQYTGEQNPRPFFFLGSLMREDLYAVGGDDEDFQLPGWEDNWLAYRLTRGRGLVPTFLEDVVGHHQWHGRPEERQGIEWGRQMYALYERKKNLANADPELCVAASGAWPMEVPA